MADFTKRSCASRRPVALFLFHTKPSLTGGLFRLRPALLSTNLATMKKLLFILVAILAIAGFSYYYFSAPKVLERRLDSLLASLSFGTITLKDMDKEGDNFASHFASEVEFSGAGNSIISGTVSPADMKEMYLIKFRTAAKSSQAERTGDFYVKLRAADEAEMDVTISMDIILRDNLSYPQEMPARLIWKKENGSWVISEVQMREPLEQELNF